MGAPMPSASHKARTIISYFILYISTPRRREREREKRWPRGLPSLPEREGRRVREREKKAQIDRCRNRTSSCVEPFRPMDNKQSRQCFQYSRECFCGEGKRGREKRKDSRERGERFCRNGNVLSSSVLSFLSGLPASRFFNLFVWKEKEERETERGLPGKRRHEWGFRLTISTLNLIFLGARERASYPWRWFIITPAHAASHRDVLVKYSNGRRVPLIYYA